MSTHLKLCLATAKYSIICKILDKTFENLEG